MREEHNLRSWEGFLRRLKTLEKSKRRLLFAAHGDSRWSLETTLERHGQKAMPLADYYRMMATRVRPQLESFTGRRFDVPSYAEFRPLFTDYDEFSRKGFPPEVCSYLIHARHQTGRLSLASVSGPTSKPAAQSKLKHLPARGPLCSDVESPTPVADMSAASCRCLWRLDLVRLSTASTRGSYDVG